ncbi:xanthine dehydrogenase small subunit [soil metagenome]
MQFILNEQTIATDEPAGLTVLDFVRYKKNLKGTKIGCREGDCGACTILVGELVGERVKYRTMTSCLMPLANAAGKHIVTIEGINPPDRKLTPVQQAMVDESGTQCGFCTVGFVMSLTGFCLDRMCSLSVSSPHVSKGSPSPLESAISSIDGNICRCTGYKSIERAAVRLSTEAESPASAGREVEATRNGFVPDYFTTIAQRLSQLAEQSPLSQPLTQSVLPFVAGGTDAYVQRPETMADSETTPLLYDDRLRGVREHGEFIEIGASATVTDLLESPVMQSVFPDLYRHLKLVSSTPIRNMATLAGNFINASPIGDMTVWFLALDAEIVLSSPRDKGEVADASADGVILSRELKLRSLYLGYKQLSKKPDEIVTAVRFRKPTGNFRFNFEKVSKRTYLDIATVNTAISMERRHPAGSSDLVFETVHLSAGGVAPIPMYLKETSAFLRGREINEETVTAANEIMQSEIAPISDVRGSADYKRLLLRQLFRAHFVELFDL